MDFKKNMIVSEHIFFIFAFFNHQEGLKSFSYKRETFKCLATVYLSCLGWDATITNSFLPSVKNDADMPAINNTDCQDLSNIITNESKSVVSLAKLQARSVAQTKSSTAPMLLKPIAIIKGSNGILNTVDSKSQIKIGNNIFAIIQKGSGVNSNVSGSSKMTTLREELIKTPRTFSLRDELAKPVKAKLFPPNMNFTPKHEDHDYIDDTDIRMGGTMGISKVIYSSLLLILFIS